MPKNFRTPFGFVCSLLLNSWLLVGLSGCNTTSPTPTAAATPQATRVAEFKADYEALPATTQKQLADGLISQGQNAKLVYLALGRPDLIVTTPNARIITWTYRNYVPPVNATSRTVIGPKTKENFTHNNTPLQDTMEAWNYKVLKHEVPYSPEGSDMTKWEPQIVPKAPTQSWGEYGKYRLQIDAVKGYDNSATTSPEVLTRLKNITKSAELAYEEALTIPPISSPDPIKLDVIFVDGRVSDAIVDDSFSAFSLGPLPLNATAAPGASSQVPQP